MVSAGTGALVQNVVGTGLADKPGHYYCMDLQGVAVSFGSYYRRQDNLQAEACRQLEAGADNCCRSVEVLYYTRVKSESLTRWELASNY